MATWPYLLGVAVGASIVSLFTVYESLRYVRSDGDRATIAFRLSVLLWMIATNSFFATLIITRT